MFQSSELGSAGECQERANPKLLFQLQELMKRIGVKLGHRTWLLGIKGQNSKAKQASGIVRGSGLWKEGTRSEYSEINSDCILRS